MKVIFESIKPTRMYLRNDIIIPKYFITSLKPITDIAYHVIGYRYALLLLFPCL